MLILCRARYRYPWGLYAPWKHPGLLYGATKVAADSWVYGPHLFLVEIKGQPRGPYVFSGEDPNRLPKNQVGMKGDWVCFHKEAVVRFLYLGEHPQRVTLEEVLIDWLGW